MKHSYKNGSKIKYNNKLFQIVIREDNKIGFYRIEVNNDKIKLVYPSAQEFLHLNSVLNVKNKIKF